MGVDGAAGAGGTAGAGEAAVWAKTATVLLRMARAATTA